MEKRIPNSRHPAEGFVALLDQEARKRHEDRKVLLRLAHRLNLTGGRCSKQGYVYTPATAPLGAFAKLGVLR